jgi:uncharacterized SAM-binding protein YcdF (DUF218 family)
MSVRGRKALTCVVILLAATLLAGFGRVSILREIGSFLIVEDSLQPVAAIVVLAGEGKPPFRAIEAARLYRAGWAPLVVIVRGAHGKEFEPEQDRAIESRERSDPSRETLMREGVPVSAIFLVKHDARNTLQELQAVFRALPSNESPVILVTSQSHTRRTRLTWQYVTQGQSRAIMRTVATDSFNANRWWQRREWAWSVAHEYLGLINAYVGFPVGRGWDARKLGGQ